jgi:ABC-type branched-subunit amino acid transport system substrate-binding protein
VDLLVVPHGNSPQETMDTLGLALAREGVFAVVGPYTVGLDKPLLEVLRADAVPLVGPFTLDPGDGILDTNAFYIYSGFAEQVRALAELALGEPGESAAPVVVAGPAGDQTARLADAVRGQVAGRVAVEPVVLDYPPGAMDAAALAGRVADSGGEALFFFGNQAELEALLGALAERDSTPRVYALGTFVSPPYDGPGAFNNRIYLAYPTLPADVTESGRSEYQRLAQRHALPPDHVQGQLAALAAAKLFVAALREAGRDLSREAFEEALEGLYRYETGVTPPLTYGPTRRVGARGAHVTVVDMMRRQQRPAGPWVDLK